MVQCVLAAGWISSCKSVGWRGYNWATNVQYCNMKIVIEKWGLEESMAFETGMCSSGEKPKSGENNGGEQGTPRRLWVVA